MQSDLNKQESYKISNLNTEMPTLQILSRNSEFSFKDKEHPSVYTKEVRRCSEQNMIIKLWKSPLC